MLIPNAAGSQSESTSLITCLNSDNEISSTTETTLEKNIDRTPALEKAHPDNNDLTYVKFTLIQLILADLYICGSNPCRYHVTPTIKSGI